MADGAVQTWIFRSCNERDSIFWTANVNAKTTWCQSSLIFRRNNHGKIPKLSERRAALVLFPSCCGTCPIYLVLYRILLGEVWFFRNRSMLSPLYHLRTASDCNKGQVFYLKYSCVSRIAPVVGPSSWCKFWKITQYLGYTFLLADLWPKMMSLECY